MASVAGRLVCALALAAVCVRPALAFPQFRAHSFKEQRALIGTFASQGSASRHGDGDLAPKEEADRIMCPVLAMLYRRKMLVPDDTGRVTYEELKGALVDAGTSGKCASFQAAGVVAYRADDAEDINRSRCYPWTKCGILRQFGFKKGEAERYLNIFKLSQNTDVEHGISTTVRDPRYDPPKPGSKVVHGPAGMENREESDLSGCEPKSLFGWSCGSDRPREVESGPEWKLYCCPDREMSGPADEVECSRKDKQWVSRGCDNLSFDGRTRLYTYKGVSSCCPRRSTMIAEPTITPSSREERLKKWYLGHLDEQGRMYAAGIGKVIAVAARKGDRSGEKSVGDGVENSFMSLIQMRFASAGWLAAFGRTDANGFTPPGSCDESYMKSTVSASGQCRTDIAKSLYFTADDLRAMFLESKMPEGWSKRPWGFRQAFAITGLYGPTSATHEEAAKVKEMSKFIVETGGE